MQYRRMAGAARLGTVAVLVAATLVATAAPVLAHGVLDQTTDGTPDAACSAAAYPGSKLVTLQESRQSFVPSRGGLSAVEVCIQDLVGVAGTDVTVRVYEGGTAANPGPEVAAVPVDVGGSLLGAHWVHVDLPVDLDTTPGVRYVLGLDPTAGVLSSVTFQWRATCADGLLTTCEGTADAYPDGATNDLPANADYAFRTYPLHPADLVGDVDVDVVVCPGLDLTDRAAGTVTNAGSTSVGPFATQWHLSRDPALDADDVAVVDGRTEVAGIPAGQQVTIPPPPALPGEDELTAGPWYLLLDVDVDRTVVESIEDNNVAASLTTVTACGQPAIDDLALRVDEDRVPTGFRQVAAADLPFPDLAQGLPQTFAEAQETVETSPYGFSPVGFSPVGFSPVGFSPVGFSPYGFSPVGFSPVGFSPVGFSPVGFSPLSALLDDLPSALLEQILVVNVPVAGAGWEQRLEGLIGDRPVQDVTLGEAATLLPDLTVQDVDLRPVLQASWLSVALANGALDDTPLPDGTPWCTWFAGQGFDCASAGIDPGTDSLLAAEAAGAPVRDAPIGDVTLAATTRNPAWLVQSMPLTGSPRAHLELTRLGGLSATEALVDPDTVVDCNAFDCDRPLSEAVVGEALRPVDVGTLVAGLSPAGLEAATLTDLALLVADLGSLDLGDMRWTLANPYWVDPGCTPMTYHLTGTNTGTGAVAPDATVTLAPGFAHVPGSATLAVDGQDPVAQPEPLVTRAADGARTLTFALEGTVTSTFDLAFRACASLYLGHQEVGHATLSGPGIDGPWTTATDPAAADLVQVVELTEEDGPADTPDTAQPVAPNDVVALHLQSAEDVDFLQVPVPSTPDSLTIVRVFPPPTVDADVVVHGPAQSPFGFSPVGFSPVGFSPVGFSPVGFSPYGFSPYGFSDAGAPVNGEEDTAQPDTLDDVPTHLAPSDTSGLRALSANRGDQPETVYLRNHDGDEGVFTIGVSGYNGVRSDAPVIVTIQQVAPTPDPQLAVCAPAPWDLSQPAGTAPAAWEGAEPPRTLLVTNRQVTASTHGSEAAAAGIAALETLAARDDVRGIVLEVDHVPAVRQAYADWRDDWCSPTAANVAASHVRAEILRLRAQHPTIDTVVLAGGDEVLPDFRLVDTSLLANESQYSDTLVRAYGANTALVAAYARGTIPSVDPYGTSAPTVYGQSFAYTPDAGVSRLVETPADWVMQVDAYLAADGLLHPDDAAISAYDGMVDGATAAADVLRGAGVDTTLLTDEAGPWSAGEFRTTMLTAPGPDLAGFNAHTNHWALLSALGSAEPHREADEIVTSDETQPLPLGGIVFSNGCHFGTQAPDSQNRDPDAAEAVRLGDWNQALTGRGGIAVTNSGFGIFETEVVGYGEQLQQLFVEALTTAPNASIALAQAKTRYMATLSLHDPYSYKTVQQLSMYGLGLLRMAGATAPPPPPTPADATAIDVSTGELQFATTTSERGTIVDVAAHPTAVDTTPLAVNGRPITPKLTLEVPLPEGRASAGVWITGIRSTLVDDVDPVIARLGVSRTDRDTESQTRHTIFPTTPVSVIDHDGVAHVTYPVGAFSSDDPVDGRARGTLRLDDRVDAQLLLRDAGPPTPAPSITEVVTAATSDGSRIVVDLLADETAGPAVRAAVLGRDEHGQWTYGELARGANGRWTGSIPLGDGGTRLVELVAQVSTGDNVGYWRNKGEPPRVFQPVFDGVDVLLASAAGQHPSGVFRGDVEGTIDGSPGVVYTVFDGDRLLATIGDGETFTLTGDGVHQVVVEGSDGSVALLSVVIDGSAPTVEIVSPAPGTVVGVGAQLVLDARCLDTGTGADCTATVDGVPVASGEALPTDRVGDHTIVVTAVDGVGREASASRTYTVESRYVASEFFSPIRPRPQLNTVSPGSSIAVKFTVTDPDGNAYTDPSIVESRTWVPIDCRTKAVTGTAVPAAGSVPEYSGFFHFNVTAPASLGCYALVVTLDDGTELSAYFDVKSTGGGGGKKS